MRYIIGKYKGYFVLWENTENYKEFNPISPLFINNKQLIDWYLNEYKKGRL